MAHIRTARLVCDKCGLELEIDPSISDPFASTFAVSESNYSDWGHVGGRHFCGDCHAALDEIRARHADELRRVFGI